ncbi:hypothetical protein KEM56_005052 [Ascosphaera pollenicola]|nr:hypothetical protein KEM56_005052 [Ascosphaera pollenicola]
MPESIENNSACPVTPARQPATTTPAPVPAALPATVPSGSPAPPSPRKKPTADDVTITVRHNVRDAHGAYVTLRSKTYVCCGFAAYIVRTHFAPGFAPRRDLNWKHSDAVRFLAKMTAQQRDAALLYLASSKAVSPCGICVSGGRWEECVQMPILRPDLACLSCAFHNNPNNPSRCSLVSRRPDVSPRKRKVPSADAFCSLQQKVSNNRFVSISGLRQAPEDDWLAALREMRDITKMIDLRLKKFEEDRAWE